MLFDLARTVRRNALDSLRRRRRARIAFSCSRTWSPEPTVYFLAPDYNLPSGGTKTIYRHVDILNASGLRACALHERAGFRYTWFENATRVGHLGSTRLNINDLLVVCEHDVELLWRRPPGVRHVIFNQSGHMTWERGREQVNRHYRADPSLCAVIVVSAHSLDLLRYAFPDTPIRRVHLGLDSTLFYPPEGPRPARITYMPRRGKADADLVLALMSNRGVFKGWDIVKLHGLPHAEVARQLRASAIFLAFPYQEGFGLPAAEAMACGNYVIGYHGYGGREFLDPAFSTPIEPGDVLGFARALERVIASETREPGWCAAHGRQASQYVLKAFSLEREAQEVAALYRELLEQVQINPARSVVEGTQ